MASGLNSDGSTGVGVTDGTGVGKYASQEKVGMVSFAPLLLEEELFPEELGRTVGVTVGRTLGLGVSVGMGVGIGVGRAVGAGVGVGVGFGVGTGVGFGVRDGVGFGVGDGVGFGVGTGVGFGVGDGVGFGVGDGVGFGVGDGVGFGVGDGVGFGVGTGVGDGVGFGVSRGVGFGVGRDVAVTTGTRGIGVGAGFFAQPCIRETDSNTASAAVSAVRPRLFPGIISVPPVLRRPERRPHSPRQPASGRALKAQHCRCPSSGPRSNRGNT